MIRVKGYARAEARQDHWWDLAGERAPDVAGESYRAAKEAARLATAMAQHAVTVCGNQILRAFVLNRASISTPSMRRLLGVAMPVPTAQRSQHGSVIAENAQRRITRCTQRTG